MRRWGLLAAVAALLVAAPVAQAAFPGQNGLIAFEKQDAGAIFTMRPNGADRTWLARGDDPSYSPDGRMVAYTCLGVCIVPATGKGHQRIERQGAQPAFSASGRQIAFRRVQCMFDQPSTCRSDIFIMGDDGGNPRNLSRRGPTDDDFVSNPAFSSRGLIAFERNNDVWTMRANGSQQRQLTERGDALGPDFSPDGRRIVFSWLTRAEGHRVMTMRLDGSGLRKVTRTRDFADPVWSPNGRRILYVDRRRTGGFLQADIFKVKPNGERKRRVTRTPKNEGAPSWAPR